MIARGLVVVFFIITALFGFCLPAHATIIDFSVGTFADYDHVPDGFGSTAGVVVSYTTLHPDLTFAYNYIERWHTGYADMTAAGYAGYPGGVLDITLTAVNPGAVVTLNSFDIGAYYTGNYTRQANIFKIVDGNNNVLRDYTSFWISGLNADTLHPNVSAPSVSLLLGYDWNNGVNNINFSAVPLPPSLLLLAPGLVGLASVRRRFRK